MIERFPWTGFLEIEDAAVDPDAEIGLAEYPPFLAYQWCRNQNLIESPPCARDPFLLMICPC